MQVCIINTGVSLILTIKILNHSLYTLYSLLQAEIRFTTGSDAILQVQVLPGNTGLDTLRFSFDNS